MRVWVGLAEGVVDQDVISKEEGVLLALAEVGEVSAEDLAGFVEGRFGLRIDPKFIPVFKASIRAREQLEEARRVRGGSSEDR
jgi:hypothetical protein